MLSNCSRPLLIAISTCSNTCLMNNISRALALREHVPQPNNSGDAVVFEIHHRDMYSVAIAHRRQEEARNTDT